MIDVSGNHLLRSSDQFRSDDGFSPTLMGGFLIAFPLAGFGVWIFAFCSQPRGRHEFRENFTKSFCQPCGLFRTQNVYNALTSMLIMDVATGITSIVLGSALIGRCQDESMCNVSSIVFYILRGFGVIYHLMVALFAIFHLCHPSQGSSQRIVSSVFVLSIVICPVYVFYSDVAVILLAVVALSLALVIMGKSMTPTASPTFAKKKKLIVLVALFTFWTVYFPGFVTECLILSEAEVEPYIYLEVLYYTSFIVIMNGVLGCLIFSLSSEEQEMQQPQPTPQWQQPPPQWQQPPPQWQQPPPQWQQPPPQWQQPPPQWQQPPPQWQQPPPQFEHRYGTENPAFSSS